MSQALSIVINYWIRNENEYYKNRKKKTIEKMIGNKLLKRNYKSLLGLLNLVYKIQDTHSLDFVKTLEIKLSNLLKDYCNDLCDNAIVYGPCQTCHQHITRFERIANSVKVACQSDECRSISHVFINIFY